MLKGSGSGFGGLENAYAGVPEGPDTIFVEELGLKNHVYYGFWDAIPS